SGWNQKQTGADRDRLRSGEIAADGLQLQGAMLTGMPGANASRSVLPQGRSLRRMLEKLHQQGRHFLRRVGHPEVVSDREESLRIRPGRAEQRHTARQSLEYPDGRDPGQAG